jgi:hypothetical protein
MNLKQSLIIGLIISIIGLVAWEMYWRSQGIYPTFDDNEALWAVQRGRVEKATDKDIILMGSSRVLFDIQLNEWESQIGVRPIQLAFVGNTPLPIFHDVVNNTDFNGTIIVGVTPGLFFSTTSPEAEIWQSSQSKVDYYKKRTYAQISNHLLSLPLQKNLAFISDDPGVDGIKLKELVGKINIGNRIIDSMPPFHEFGEIKEDRSLKMKQITVIDTAYANSIIKVWQYYMNVAKNGPPPDKASTMNFFLKDLDIFKARGGHVILIRCPSSGRLREIEKIGLPKADFWDDLVKQAQVKSYHFEDYDQLKNLKCPEESHLSAKDAQYFTTEIAKIMNADGALTQFKTN